MAHSHTKAWTIAVYYKRNKATSQQGNPKPNWARSIQLYNFTGQPQWYLRSSVKLCSAGMVIPYRRFGTTYRAHRHMGLIGCPETSVRNYHHTLRNTSEARRSHFNRGGGLKSRINHSGMNGCRTAMCKASGKTTRLICFVWMGRAPDKTKGNAATRLP
jgi:hypothetical protein